MILIELKHCITLASLCLTVNCITFQLFHINFKIVHQVQNNEFFFFFFFLFLFLTEN